MWPCLVRIYICVCVRRVETKRHTVGFLRDLAFVGEREEELLRGWLGDGALEVGGDVDGAVWAVYLSRVEESD